MSLQVYFCAADRSMSGTTEATVGGESEAVAQNQ